MAVATGLPLACLLLLLLYVVPRSVQDQRTKRQIVFPEDENEEDEDNGGVPCITPDRRQGECIRITYCPILLRVNNFNRLRRFFCGFAGDEPMVCCPIIAPPTTRRVFTTTTTYRPRTTTTTYRPRTTTTSRPRTTTRRSRTTTRRQQIRTTTPGPDSLRFTTPTPRPVTGDQRKPNFLPRECGVSKFPKNRVVGGKEAEKGSWPWMVVVYQEKRGVKSPDCGGALVTSQHVITAAHCVVGRRSVTLSPNVLSVRLGEHDLYSDDDDMQPIDIDVVSVTKHDKFEARTYKNDIAVLKLARPVRFGEHIAPICLPYGDETLSRDLTGKRAFVAGWGTTEFNGPSSSVLMEAAFEIQDQELCKRAFKDDLPITDVYLCAGTLDGSKDSCQGDSGGPLMTVGKDKHFNLVGIVSFGKQCATPGYPGVYTRVTKFLDWLRTPLSS